ncbi:hypothetical protein ACO03_02935 [Pantoea ananatis]|nr:hypothetical protein ACO03_02935 [Pantoea ananatis]
MIKLPDELTPKAASRAYGGQVEGYRDGWNACIAEVQLLNANRSHDFPKNLNWLLDLSKACHVIGVPVRLSDSQVEEISEAFRELEQRLNATAQPVSAPEWTNEQCLEFLSIAFRHANISGDIEMDDIRLGIRMVNAEAAPGGQ